MSSSLSRFSGWRSRSLSLGEGLTDSTGARDGTRADAVLDRGRRRLLAFLAFCLAAPSSYRVDRGRHLAVTGVLSLRHFRLARWCSLSLGGWWPRKSGADSLAGGRRRLWRGVDPVARSLRSSGAMPSDLLEPLGRGEDARQFDAQEALALPRRKAAFQQERTDCARAGDWRRRHPLLHRAIIRHQDRCRSGSHQ
jgi:hypothetical protein